MKSARVNFGVRPNSLSTCRKAGNRDDVHEDRVAVRLRARRQTARRLAPAAPALVSITQRLLEDRLEHGCKGPADDIDSAAWRERIDEVSPAATDSLPARRPGAVASVAAAAAEPTTKLRLSMASSVRSGFFSPRLLRGCYRGGVARGNRATARHFQRPPAMNALAAISASRAPNPELATACWSCRGIRQL